MEASGAVLEVGGVVLEVAMEEEVALGEGEAGSLELREEEEVVEEVVQGEVLRMEAPFPWCNIHAGSSQ